MNTDRRLTIVSLAMPLLMISAFILGHFTAPKVSAETQKTAGKVIEVSRMVEALYPADVPREKLERAAVEGMLTALDPACQYFDAEEWREYRERHMDGRFSGVGILIEPDEASGLLRITTPIEDTPAFAADVLPGDLIATVDGEDIKGKSQNDIVKRIKGLKGTPVKLGLRRAGREQLVIVELIRADINIKAVKHRMTDPAEGIGYVRITDFTDMIPQFDTAMADLFAKGVKAVVVDVRFNGGGLLQAAADLSDRFIPAGKTLLTTKGKVGDENRTFTSKGKDDLPPIPLVVLVNGGTASASEIFAGAMKDLQRGTIVGSRTYGKGTMQTPIDLRDGSHLKITTARWYTPSGANVHRDEGRKDYGLVPDYLVEMSGDEEAALMRRWSEERTIKGQGEIEPKTPARDFQLEAGVEILRARLAGREPSVAPRELAKLPPAPGPTPK